MIPLRCGSSLLDRQRCLIVHGAGVLSLRRQRWTASVTNVPRFVSCLSNHHYHLYNRTRTNLGADNGSIHRRNNSNKNLLLPSFAAPCVNSCYHFSSRSSDAAQSACRANRSSSSSPQSINEAASTTTASASTTNNNNNNNNNPSQPTALFFAAKEAERITSLAGEQSTRMKMVSVSREEDESRRQQQAASSCDASSTTSSSSTTTTNSALTTTTTTSNAQQALDAARSLLIVSRPSNALADAILAAQQSSSSLVTNPTTSSSPPPCAEIASLHRAFLAITSWCLDVLETKQQQQNMSHSAPLANDMVPRNEEEEEEQQQPTTTTTTIRTDDILDRALTVSRRAHDLNLPFHLPLYQRLMVAVARQQQSQNHAPPRPHQYAATEGSYHNDPEYYASAAVTATTVQTILEIASWVESRLDASAVTANLFVPALRILMEQRQYPAVALLLVGMQSIYGLADLEHNVALEFWNQLRVNTSSRHDRDENEDDDFESSSDSTDHLISADDQAVSDIMERLEDTIVQYIESAGEAESEMMDVSQTKHDAVNAADNDLSENDSDQDDHDQDDESDDEFMDPLDQVIDKLLSFGFSESQVRRALQGWIESMNRSNPSSSRSKRGSLLLPGIEIFGAFYHGGHLFVAGEIRSRKKSSAVKKWMRRTEGDDLSIDSDSDDEVDGDRDEIIYLRQNSCKFPDVTAQLEQLNGNRKLLFTAQYEEILWMRDYDEELYGEGGEHGIMFQRSDDTDSDSDDDDDDDEDGI